MMDNKSTEKSVKKSAVYITCKNQEYELRKTKKGWELLIEWSDWNMTWQSLSYTKEYLPTQFTEYSQGGGIIEEP